MRLVAVPDGAISATDRGLWLTQPFDLVWFVWITPECRILRVAAESRTLAVDLEDRTLTAVDDRVLSLAADDRTLAVGAEDRVYEVRCGQ